MFLMGLNFWMGIICFRLFREPMSMRYGITTDNGNKPLLTDVNMVPAMTHMTALVVPLEKSLANLIRDDLDINQSPVRRILPVMHVV